MSLSIRSGYVLFLCLVIFFFYFACIETVQEQPFESTYVNHSTGNISKVTAQRVTPPENNSLVNSSNISASESSTIVSENTSLENLSLNASSSLNKTRVDYYYSSVCQFCIAIKPHIQEIEKKYENETKWYWFNVLTNEGLESYNQMALHFNFSLAERVVPVVVINNTHLSDLFQINASLESLIINESFH